MLQVCYFGEKGSPLSWMIVMSYAPAGAWLPLPFTLRTKNSGLGIGLDKKVRMLALINKFSFYN